MLPITTIEKLHQVFQSNGFRYCPIEQTEDSPTLPPAKDDTCTSGGVYGYYIFESPTLKIMYNTRCYCSRTVAALYNLEAKRFLNALLPHVQTICPEATIETSKKGRPFINCHTFNMQKMEDTLCYPLRSPYSEYTFTPILPEEKK